MGLFDIVNIFVAFKIVKIWCVYLVITSVSHKIRMYVIDRWRNIESIISCKNRTYFAYCISDSLTVNVRPHYTRPLCVVYSQRISIYNILKATRYNHTQYILYAYTDTRSNYGYEIFSTYHYARFALMRCCVSRKRSTPNWRLQIAKHQHI